MADSKFLPYQDQSGDGLIDVCPEEVVAEECLECRDCIPNPCATVPNWRNLKVYEPFLNEKICKYQITKVTKHTTTGAPPNATKKEAADALKKIYDEHVNEVLKILLDVNNKDNSDASVEIAKSSVEYTDFHLDLRPKSRLKLQYSLSYETLNSLPEREDDEDEEGEESDIEVTYEASELVSKLLIIRKGLHLYSRHLKVYRAIERSNILFKEDNSIFNLEDYGDYGTYRGSTMARLLPYLDDFLHGRGYNMPQPGKKIPNRTRIDKLTFTFDKDYEIKKLMIYTVACPKEPVIFTEGLDPLKNKAPWKDPTAIAYFTRLSDMENDLTGQAPLGWVEFVEKYTYPEVHSIADYGYNEEIGAPSDETGETKTAANCIGDALKNEAKQFGQDVLDDVFSIGDAIAYKFHQINLCECDPEEQKETEINMGLRYPLSMMGTDTVVGMAKMQAYQTLKEENPMAAWLCGSLLAGDGMPAGIDFPEIRLILDRAKVCGLLDLMFTGIECLFSGFSLEDALGAAILSCLNAMSIENFGKLFVGLPAEEQAELEAIVKQRLESGDINVGVTCGIMGDDDQSDADDDASTDTSTSLTAYKPWEDEKIIEAEKRTMTETSFTSMTPSAGKQPEEKTQSEVRTLAPSYDESGEEEKADSASIMILYVQALIDNYSGRLLELIDQLMDFPGAEVIARILAVVNMFTCPVPPGPGWTFSGLLNDLGVGLPNPCSGCFQGFELTFPRFGSLAIPNWKDILKYLFNLIKKLLMELLIRILMKLIAKICELIGDAICKALQTVGDAAMALPSLVTGKNTLKDVIRASICGEDVDDETLDNTIVEMFSLLGAGGAAMADQQQTLSFAQDVSSAVTQRELTDAFLGNPSSGFLEIVDSLIEHEYTDFRSGLKDQTSIASMFKNMGNLMPAEFRAQLRDVEMGDSPANPSLCASPDQLEQFCDLRSSLLDGRASKDQLEKLCAPDLSDITDLSTMMQSIPSYLECNMPQIQSDPGCNNGLLPYEPDEVIQATTAVLGAQFQALKAAYSLDMMGSGPGEPRWGMMNMILSDTMGNPLTAHYRKASNRRRYVDFYMNDPSREADLDNISPSELFTLLLGPPALKSQKGAFPQKVAEWMQQYINEDLKINFKSNNDYEEETVSVKSLDNLSDSDQTIWFLPIESFSVLSLPDLGYNVDTEVDYENNRVSFVKKGRKATPDLSLKFEDNAKGLKSGLNAVSTYGAPQPQSDFSYGFELKMYLSDLVKGPVEPVSCTKPDDSLPIDETIVYNRPGDNVRIKLIEKFNMAADVNAAAESMILDVVDIVKTSKEAKTIKDRRYEFLAVDDTLEEIDLDEYTEFLSTFEGKQHYIPQIILLKEIVNSNLSLAAVTTEEIKDFYDETMSSMINSIMADIAGNTAAFDYGARFDDLTGDDVEYVTNDGVPYNDSGYENNDMVLGKSYDQYINEQNETPEDTRVFYLSPMTFGGSYMNPPIYIKPVKNEGWLGFIDVLFPEPSPCETRATDLVDFSEIQDVVEQVYPDIPEDARLQEDPSCSVELPYNRILERSSTAAIQGLITAAIRIYATTHFIKSMATFTKFSPRFTEVFSSMYASYIIEDMEESLKDAQPDFGELFSSFKDEEFWYAFLEQSVQMYARQVEAGDITPPANVLRALIRLNDVQEEYQPPSAGDLKRAKENGEVPSYKKLNHYRAEKNLEAVKATEETAKLIMKEVVIEQLNYMGEKFIKNLKTNGMAPDVFDIDYYLLENFTQGSTLTIDEDIKPVYPNLPTEGENHYTGGNELVVKEDLDGIEDVATCNTYIGYYHVTQDDNGDIMFMAGEYHSDKPHDILSPMVHMSEFPVGDVEEYPFTASSSATQPFVIEKYTKIQNVKMAPSSATTVIKSNNWSQNISDVYPGDLRLVNDEEGNVAGMEGELGVRHGLLFSIVINGTKYEITSAEVDALDLTIGEYEPVSGNSKLLLCLINLLKEDDKFKLVSRYILGLPKLTAFAAIYNDLAFLPSIGEVTVADGGAFGGDSSEDAKPGVYVESVQEENGSWTSEVSESRGEPGWASVKDRSPGWFGGLFVTEWDNWDQVLLRKTKRMLKKQFNPNYNCRDFNFGDAASRPAQAQLAELKSSLKPAAGSKILPRWRRRRLRSNPFNIDGELCEKED